MKRLIVIFLLFPFALSAQLKSFDALFDAYTGKQGVETHKIGKLLIAAGRTTGTKGIPDGLNSFNSVTIAEISEVAPGVFDALQRDAKSVCACAPYFVLTDRTVKGSTIRAYAKPVENSDKVKDVIFYIITANSISVVCMKGEFSKDEQFIKELKTRE